MIILVFLFNAEIIEAYSKTSQCWLFRNTVLKSPTRITKVSVLPLDVHDVLFALHQVTMNHICRSNLCIVQVVTVLTTIFSVTCYHLSPFQCIGAQLCCAGFYQDVSGHRNPELAHPLCIDLYGLRKPSGSDPGEACCSLGPCSTQAIIPPLGTQVEQPPIPRALLQMD